jgi:adenylylsulfate kinase
MNNKVIWFYGISGSGKTTCAKYLKDKFPLDASVVHLDADELRSELWPEVGLSKDSRIQNTDRIAKLTRLFSSAGCTVIVSACAPFQQQRDNVKSILPGVKFVHVNTPLQICAERKPQFYQDFNIYTVLNVDVEPYPWRVITGDQRLSDLISNIDKLYMDMFQ